MSIPQNVFLLLIQRREILANGSRIIIFAKSNFGSGMEGLLERPRTKSIYASLHAGFLGNIAMLEVSLSRNVNRGLLKMHGVVF